MALFTLTVNNQAPALEHKSGEAALIAQALATAAQTMQASQGTVTSGNIIGNGGVTLGSWTYTPQGSLP